MAKKSKSIISSILIGGAIGSVLGMMYAPEKGVKNRQKILTFGKKYLKKGKEKSFNLFQKIKIFCQKNLIKRKKTSVNNDSSYTDTTKP